MGNEQSTPGDAARPLGVAIVGCGQISTHHVEAKAAVVAESRRTLNVDDDKPAPPPLLRIAALVDPDAERRKVIKKLCFTRGLTDAKTGPTPEFDSIDELMAHKETFDSVDIIFIAIPHDLHVSVGTQALRSGKDVVIEKPLAPTLEGCKALRSAAAEEGSGLLIVAEQSPYWEEIVKAKSLIEEGKIGKIVSASAYYYESMRDNITSGQDPVQGLGWRKSLERCGGGAVMDGGLHWIRPLREMCGEITEVVGTTDNVQKGLEMEGETIAHALFKIQRKQKAPTMNGAASNGEAAAEDKPLVATYSANLMHTAPMAYDTCPYFRITGTAGELIVYGTGLNPKGGGGLKLYDEEHPEGEDLFSSDRKGGFFLGFRGLWKAVAEIVKKKDGELAEKSVVDGTADVATVLALYESAKSGKWEKCESS